jgi:uncharacterized protein (TIGR02421 family)
MNQPEPEIAELVKDRLTAGSNLDLMLPEKGRLFIDRPLPFLLVHRFSNGKDQFLQNLLMAEASGLLIHRNLTAMARTIASNLADYFSSEFGSYLILEIWKSEQPNNQTFRIYGPHQKIPEVIDYFKSRLENIKNFPLAYRVEVIDKEERAPEGLDSLLNKEEIMKKGALLLGLEIPGFYFNAQLNLVYPQVAEILQRELSQIIQRTVFEFIKVHSTHSVQSFRSLGRRNLDTLVWEIDAELAEIDQIYDFLLLVSPLNSNEAWEEFQQNNFSKAPTLKYRLIPRDPNKVKRRLYNLPLENIHDPTFGYLFQEKRSELDKMLTMLAHRNQENFRYGSLQMFGGVEKNLVNQASGYLSAFPFDDNYNQEEQDAPVDSNQFYQMAIREFRYLKDQYPQLEELIEIKSNSMDLMVNKGKLIIPENLKLSESRAEALIQHEIGTHVLTYFNGKAQPLKLLYTGVPGYEELQEGLAILAEFLSGNLSISRLQILAARVIAVDSLIRGYTFVNTFQLLVDEFNLPQKLAFKITLRVHRSGGLTKDAVYLKGFINLLEYIKAGNDPEDLLIGKIRQDYIPIIHELQNRQILKKAPVKPRYLQEKPFRDRLKLIRKQTNIFNLIQ